MQVYLLHKIDHSNTDWKGNGCILLGTKNENTLRDELETLYDTMLVLVAQLRFA